MLAARMRGENSVHVEGVVSASCQVGDVVGQLGSVVRVGDGGEGDMNGRREVRSELCGYGDWDSAVVGLGQC